MKRAKSLIILFMISIFILCFVYSLLAQDTSGEASTVVMKIFDSSGKLRIEAFLTGGAGLKQLEVGETTEGKEITISGGGGVGEGLIMGYGIFTAVEAFKKSFIIIYKKRGGHE